jgi:hypothetical protein
MSICKQTYYNNGSYLRARSNEKAICELITEIEDGSITPYIVSSGGTIGGSLTITGNLTITGTAYYSNVSYTNVTFPNGIDASNINANIITAENSVTAGTITTSYITPEGNDLQIGGSSATITLISPLKINYTSAISTIDYVGYYYYSTTHKTVNIESSAETGYVFSPQSTDSVPPVLLPIGIYRIDMNCCITGNSLNVTTLSYSAGYASSASSSMTASNTTRVSLIGSDSIADNSFVNGLTQNRLFSCSGLFTVSATGSYYAGYATATLGTRTVGSVDCKIISVFISRVA